MATLFDQAARTGRRVAVLGIAASAGLAALNIAVGLLTRSTSVVATVVEFAGDLCSRRRSTGFRYHVDLHIEVDLHITVAAAHVIGGRVRHRVREQLGWVADVFVHIEPAPEWSV